MNGLGITVFIRNSAATLGRHLIAGLIQLVTFVIIARTFGPEGNGQYAVALLLPAILATFLNLGIAPANVYHLGSGKVAVRTAIVASVKLWLVLSAIGVMAGYLGINIGAAKLFPGINHDLLLLSLIAFPVSLLQGFILSIFQGVQKFKQLNFILIIQPVMTLAAVTIIVLAGNKDITYVVVAYIVSLTLTTLVSIFFLPFQEEKIMRPQSEVSYRKDAVNYGYKSALGNILAYLNYKADIFLINFLINPAAAGVYVVAVQLVERLWLLSQSVSMVLLPRLSELNSDEEKRKQLTPIICRWVIAVTFAGAVVLGSLAYILIKLFFGESYIGAVTPLLLLLPGIVAGSGARILANDIAARGRPELNMYTAMIVLVLNIVGNLVVIPVYGLAGAAVVTSFTYTINLFLKLNIYNRFVDKGWSELLLIKAGDIRMLFAGMKNQAFRV